MSAAIVPLRFSEAEGANLLSETLRGGFVGWYVWHGLRSVFRSFECP